VTLPSVPVVLSKFTSDRIVSFTKLGLFAIRSSVTFCMVCTNSPVSSALVMKILMLVAKVELVN